MFAEAIDREEHVRWLDIGAGFGELVKAVTRVLPSADITGLEPNEAKRRVAKTHGVSLSGARLSDLPRHGFDVASLMNLWSHLPDPVEFLGEVRSLLADGAHIIIETGNGADLSSAALYPDALYLPDHLSFAGERHVVGILERTGFQIDVMRRRRVDTLAFALSRAAKRVLGRPSRLIVPYRSEFRSIVVRARTRA